MKIGVCIGSEAKKISISKEIGFDYVESGFSMLTNEDPAEFNLFQSELNRVGMTCESVNCFLPGSLPVVGEKVDDAALYDYVKRGMENGSRLGVQTVVFGSGGARRIPEGFPYEKAVRQFISFLRNIAGPLADSNGITIVIEPLSLRDTNFINSAKEGAAIAAAADLPNVKALVDLFHMEREGDTVSDILSIGSFLHHAHIAEPKKRVYPAAVDEFDYGSFIHALEKVGCPRCSLEAGCGNFAKEGALAVKVLKSF